MTFWGSFCVSLIFAAGLVAAVGAEPIAGVVEGFYWSEADAVNGQYGRLSLTQRLELVSLAAQYNFTFYWFAPQSISTVSPWTAEEKSGWTETANLAASLKIQIVYGLRPGYLDTASIDAALAKLDELVSVGITSYSLNFDDAAGAGAQAQLTAQVSLVSQMQTDYPGLHLFTFVPNAYHGDLFADKTAWEAALATLDGMNASVPMTFTGMTITPMDMTPSQFPSLSSGRRTFFWDNWIAVDSSSRLPWGLIRNRDSALWTSSSYGYVLNLAFPLERVIHQLNCLNQLLNNPSASCNVSIAATDWESWLFAHGFVHSGRSSFEVQSALQSAIEADNAYNSIAELEAAFPALSTIFSTPPIVADSPSVSGSAPVEEHVAPSASPMGAVAPSTSSDAPSIQLITPNSSPVSAAAAAQHGAISLFLVVVLALLAFSQI